MSGWICSYRAIWDHPIFRGNAERVGVWDWMLKTAAWRKTKFDVGGSIITLQRGQLCVAQRQVSDATGMSRQSFRTFLRLLVNEGAIKTETATKSTQARTLITICKYDVYQVQQEATNPASTQRQPIKEQLNNIPVGADDKSPPVDPVKIMFAQGRKILADGGMSSSQAGSILGKWRKDHGVEAVIAALGRCQREGAVDPVSFIQGCFRFQAKTAGPQHGDRKEMPNGTTKVFMDNVTGWVVEHA